MREALKGIGSAWLFAAGVLLVVIPMAAMWIFGFGVFQRETANFRGDVDVQEQTDANADFRIQAYDRFFNLCAAVRADEGRLANMEAELEQDISDDRREQLQASITGVRNARVEKIAEYNAAATADYTTGEFRDSDLPFRLDPNDEETTCAAS